MTKTQQIYYNLTKMNMKTENNNNNDATST